MSLPRDVAVDSAGNVYWTNAGSEYVEWNAATQTLSLNSLLESQDASGVAVDAAGNVYVADRQDDAIFEWNAATQKNSRLAPSALNSTTLESPGGLAVDAAGNLYIANTGDNAIEEWDPTTQTLTTLVSSGLSRPDGVAVDSGGNVFIADTDDNAIKEWDPTTQTLSTLVSSGLSQPEGVAVDGGGNVFIADTGDNAIKEWNAATQTLSTLVSSGLDHPEGVAVDGAGNVFIADFSNNAIEEVPRAFVSTAPVTEESGAGSDVLPPVLPATVSLTGIFAPTSDQSWLTVGAIAGGQVGFSFTANTSSSPRTAQLTVLGQSITVTQEAGSTIVVNNPTDTPVAGQIDLRQAIGLANLDGGDETITFDSTVFQTPRTISLTGGQLELSDTTGTTTIVGPQNGVTVSGGGLSRVFQVDALVNASIWGLTITGGEATDFHGVGGGLHNLGTATLTDCTVSGNSAAGSGGGLFAYSYAHDHADQLHRQRQLRRSRGGGLGTTPAARPR